MLSNNFQGISRPIWCGVNISSILTKVDSEKEDASLPDYEQLKKKIRHMDGLLVLL